MVFSVFCLCHAVFPFMRCSSPRRVMLKRNIPVCLFLQKKRDCAKTFHFDTVSIFMEMRIRIKTIPIYYLIREYTPEFITATLLIIIPFVSLMQKRI